MRMVGNYKLGRELGRGATAQVFFATRESDGLEVALKVFHPGLWDRGDLKRRATGEVALAHPDAADWPVVVRRMLVEDNRMEQIVTDLLDLAREGESELPNTLVDLDDIALEEATRARRDGCTIVTEGVSAGQVRGSRELLTRVVRNLLDNAVRHAASTVRVTLRADADVTLVVEDDGPGIAPTDRAEVFERFARLDEGRARDTGGLGLGLAMVRTITERHGGSVEITDPTDPNFPGVRIIVRLRPAE